MLGRSGGKNVPKLVTIILKRIGSQSLTEYKAKKETFQELSTLRQNLRQVVGKPEKERIKETPMKDWEGE